MSPDSLLATLRALGVRLERDADELLVDAPVGALSPELRSAVGEHKHALQRLLRDEDEESRDPVYATELPFRSICDFDVRWARDRGWLAVRDPFTGEWHEVLVRECPPSWCDAARRRA